MFVLSRDIYSLMLRGAASNSLGFYRHNADSYYAFTASDVGNFYTAALTFTDPLALTVMQLQWSCSPWWISTFSLFRTACVYRM